MNSKLKVAAVIIVATAGAFGSSQVLWPPPAGFVIPPSLLPFFVGLGIVESMAFGLGVAFALFGWRLVRQTGVSPFAAWGGYLGIVWSLINWWAHDGFHRVTGLNYAGVVRIEYGFHFTLIAGGVLAAYFFLSVVRVANEAVNPKLSARAQ